MYEQIISHESVSFSANVSATDLVNKFKDWADSNNERVTLAEARSVIGKLVKSMRIKAIGRSDRNGGKFYQFPDDDKLKVLFAKHLGHKSEEIFGI
ncbi:MAG: hypothetical protein HWE10_13505 [Gammaproteobacteria bacterium]|nr:hypothetical protein [Gammaproteobacteria bacterium]